MRPSTHLRLALLALAGCACSPALAQNALGDGRALDANLQQGGGRFNAPGRNSNFAEEVRFRNAIVTGNAPGGSSFRGDAGYLSTDDFRAPLGSDSFFGFQRDSLYSGLATRGIRGVDALRAQMALSTGGAPTYGTSELFINRSGMLSTSGNFRPDTPQISIDPFTTRAGSLRSSSAFLGSQALEPQFFGSVVDQSGRSFAIGASPLRGVIAQPLVIEESMAAPTVPGAIAPIDEALADPLGQREQGAPAEGLRFDPGSMGAAPGRTTETERTPRAGQVVATPEVGRVSEAVTTGRVASDALSNRVARRTPYDAVIDALMAPPGAEVDRAGAAEPGAPAQGAPGEQVAPPAPEPTPEDRRKFTERLEDLRREMLGLPPIDREAPAEPARRVDDEGNPIIETDPQATTRTIRERAAEFFGEAAVNIDSLAPRSTDASIYNQYMREGERLLAQERWFDAEEAFTRAINRRNGDPMAAAGRINAQLGAAMYLSAAVNLRALFTAHPEMAAVRFSDELFLRGRRLDEVIAYLRDEAAKDRPFAREAALLLSFIGHQRGDNREVVNAFNAIDRVNAVFPVGEDPLIELLKGAWLDAPARRIRE